MICVNGGLLNDDIDTWKLKQSDTCVNGGLLNDDILIKTKNKVIPVSKWLPVSMVVYWMMIF